MNPDESPAGLPDLTGFAVLVTGASGNLGAGIARRFAAAGASVALHYHRGAAAAGALAAELASGGTRAVALAADLTDPDACARLVDAAASELGGLTTLINNAGVQPVTPLADLSPADWQRVLDGNLTGVFTCTQAAAAVMECGGTITHIASIEGSQPAFGHSHYSAAKAAVIMHARAAALEYGPRGIRVNTVSPGLIARDGLEQDWPDGVARWHASAPLGRLGTPSDVGDACVFLASPLARWITGHDLVVDGGVSVHPTW
jgi:NAD(P)-dependent dehydrogenase (short-subunit alcohol dehydrogenase family)